MVAASPEKVAALLQEIAAGPRGYATLRVWYSLAPYVRRDTGEVLCTQRTLARTAGVSIGDVQRAMARLVEIGALTREEPRPVPHPSDPDVEGRAGATRGGREAGPAAEAARARLVAQRPCG